MYCSRLKSLNHSNTSGTSKTELTLTSPVIQIDEGRVTNHNSSKYMNPVYSEQSLEEFNSTVSLGKSDNSKDESFHMSVTETSDAIKAVILQNSQPITLLKPVANSDLIFTAQEEEVADGPIIMSNSSILSHQRKQTRKKKNLGEFTVARNEGDWKLPAFLTNKMDDFTLGSDVSLQVNVVLSALVIYNSLYQITTNFRPTVNGSSQTEDFSSEWVITNSNETNTEAEDILVSSTLKLVQTDISVQYRMSVEEAGLEFNECPHGDLYNCFPNVPPNYIDYVVGQGKGDMNWVMDVLLNPSAVPFSDGMLVEKNKTVENRSISDSQPIDRNQKEESLEKIDCHLKKEMGEILPHASSGVQLEDSSNQLILSGSELDSSSASTTLQFEIGTEMAADLQQVGQDMRDLMLYL